MPTRMIREGILDSEAVNRLSLEAEIFYRRLMSLVDDYGRCDGRVEIIRARLFALQFDRWSMERVVEAIAECSQTHMADGTPLVSSYEVGGKPYLQINNFGQRTRSPSRCPAPPDRAKECQQMSATRGHLSADVRNAPSINSAGAENSQIEKNLHDFAVCQTSADNRGQMSADVRPTRAQGRSESESESESESSANAGARTGRTGQFDPSPGLRRFEKLACSIREDRWLLKQAEAAWRAVVTSVEIEASVFAGIDRWRGCADWSDGVVHRWDRWLSQRMFEQDPRPAKAAEQPKDSVLAKLARRFA